MVVHGNLGHLVVSPEKLKAHYLVSRAVMPRGVTNPWILWISEPSFAEQFAHQNFLTGNRLANGWIMSVDSNSVRDNSKGKALVPGQLDSTR